MYYCGFFSFGSLLEEGGTIFTFEGTVKKSSLKVYLRIHSPQFYWKVYTLFNFEPSVKVLILNHLYLRDQYVHTIFHSKFCPIYQV